MLADRSAVATGVGLATLYLGLIVVVPLLGYATWHAYRDLVPQPETGEVGHTQNRWSRPDRRATHPQASLWSG